MSLAILLYRDAAYHLAVVQQLNIRTRRLAIRYGDGHRLLLLAEGIYGNLYTGTLCALLSADAIQCRSVLLECRSELAATVGTFVLVAPNLRNRTRLLLVEAQLGEVNAYLLVTRIRRRSLLRRSGVVVEHHKLYRGDATLVGSRIVDTCLGGKANRTLRQIIHDDGVGVRSYTLFVLLSVDGKISPVDVLVYVYLTPSASRLYHLLLREVQRRTVRQRHRRINPVGMVATVCIATIRCHQSNLLGTLRQSNIYIRSISRSKIRDGTRTIQCILRIHKLRTTQVEQRHKAVAVGRIHRRPRYHVILCAAQLLVLHGIVVHIQHIPVGQQRIRSLVVLRQVTTKHQRRLKDAPQVHHCLQLIRRKRTPTLCTPFATNTNLTHRQHIGIRPGTRSYIRCPLGTHLKLVTQLTPVIPKVVHRAPHIRMALRMLRHLHRRLTRRHTQHHGASAVCNGVANQLNLSRVVRTRKVVNLYKVYPPGSIHIETRVVILLRSPLGAVHRLVVAQPRADAIVVGYHIARNAVRAQDGQLLSHCLTRNTTHQVDTELQSLGMYIVGQLLKTRTVRSRWETVHRRGVSSVCIYAVASIRLVVSTRLVVLNKPAYIYHDILPAILC